MTVNQDATPTRRTPSPSGVVFGRVLHADGPPVAGVQVWALHRTLRGEVELGRPVGTDASGSYTIRYEPPEGLQRVDLVVRVTDPQTREVARSDLYCHARKILLVDVVVGDGPYRGYSEFERLTHAVQPHLDGASLAALTAQDVEFLACTTRQDAGLLAQFVAAHRYDERTGVPAEAFYGCSREGLPRSLPELLSQSSRVLGRALGDAVAANVVPVAMASRVEELVREMKRAAVALALEVPDGQQSTSLAGLLGAAGLSLEAQTAVLTRFALHEGTIEEYWTALKDDADVGPGTVRELQFTLQLGTLAGGYVPMVKLLQATAKDGTIEGLVGLTEQDWLALVDRSGVPPTAPGDTPTERARAYASALRWSLERAFPTPTIVAGLRRQPDVDDDLLAFFANSPDYAFTTNVDRYLADNAGTALAGIADVPALTRRLKGMQRLYRLAPDVDRLEAMTALTAAGMSSAHGIIRRGREPFVKALAPTLSGTEAANVVFDKAEQTAAVALTLFSQYGEPFIGATPAVMAAAPTGVSDTVTVPSWETLFGPFSSCACEHCRSVYSSAAYLVDLLEFVRRQPAVEIHDDGTTITPTVTELDGTVRDKTALDVLFERRADIGEIELSCVNDTELPYIDLVNEILEDVVAREPAAHQTTWTAEELQANAEHQNESAYRRLAQQVHPRVLPFNLWLFEARTYLGHLGVSLDQLADVVQRRGLERAGPPEFELRLAVERLGMSAQEAQIVMGTSSAGHAPPDYWGVTADWPDALTDLSTLLLKGDLSYDALSDLLSARFVNPDGSTVISHASPCSLEGALVLNLGEPELDRMDRFLRLQRAVGWTTLELDGAITALAATELSPQLLIGLAQIRALQEQLGRPVVESLAWWGAISTVQSDTGAGLTSLYDDLFLDNAVLSPMDVAFELDSDRGELLGAAETIGDHTSAILAALGITDAELTLALTHAGLAAADALTLEHLSAIHRTVSLARALDLSVVDFVSVGALTGIDPFASPRATLDLAGRAQVIAESEFSVAELDYLLRDVFEETSGLAPAESAMTLVLDGIGAALAAIAAENAFVSDPTGTFTQNRLALLLLPEDLEAAMAILAGTSVASDADQEAFLDEHFSLFLDPGQLAGAKPRLVGAGELAEPQARYELVLRPLLAYLRTTLGSERVVQSLADALGLEVAVAEGLLTEYVRTPGDPARPMIDMFLAIAPDTDAYDAAVLDSYRRLEKIATVLTRLQATAEELAWLFVDGQAIGWLNLARLPLATPDATAVARLFAGWARLVVLYGLRDRYAAGDATIFGVLAVARDGGIRDDALGELAAVTGWSDEDLAFLTGADGFGLTYPADYRDERWIARLEAAVALLGRLGLGAAQVAGWRLSSDLDEMRAIARDIKSTAKAKYAATAWTAVAEPLKDDLREHQRSALAAYLIATHELPDGTTGLYARYLIDVEMSACMTTSRIKQAHLSVQMFVQRCLMNLEPNVEITEAGAAEWQWMKLYRVWEANRKIFTYPETYTEPELRDDKSPIFRELENELLQNEVTDGTAETALVNYLLKLDEVANLDVRALVHDESPRDVLHVIARTHNAPHVYHYRTRVDASYWTPWQGIALDIQGDHLLAVVWNGRLRLVWPLFTEVDIGANCDELIDQLEAEFRHLEASSLLSWGDFTSLYDQIVQPLFDEIVGPNDADLQAPIDLIKGLLILCFGGEVEDYDAVDDMVADWAECATDVKRWDIQLAWAEYSDGAWTAKSVVDDVLRTAFYPKPTFLFKPTITGGILRDDIFTPIDTTGAIATQQHEGITAQVLTGGELVVTCLASDLPSPNTVLGTFRFTGCGGQVIVTADEDETTALPDLHGYQAPVDMRYPEIAYADVPLIIASVTEDGLRFPTLLNRTPGRFTLTIPHQYAQFTAQDALFYLDETRSFLVSPGLALDTGLAALQDLEATSFDDAVSSLWSTFARTSLLPHGDSARSGDRSNGAGATDEAAVAGSKAVQLGQESDDVFRFSDFYHPHTCTFLEEVAAAGIGAIMQRSIQSLSSEFFVSTYDPEQSLVPAPYPLRNVDFSFGSAYGNYNWELFFHAPLLIATRLSQNQHFEQAQRCFHDIFNPTARTDGAGVTGPERYWVFHPFYLESVPQDLTALMEALNAGDPALEEQVAQWRANPYNPHLIARLRPGAYQKTVVMKYLDNLIAWGDMLFGQDTIETLNEATQLYVLAADILGPRPEPLPATDLEDTETYNTLADKLDDFSNALVAIEDALPAASSDPAPGPLGPLGPLGPRAKHAPSPTETDIDPPPPMLEMLYFCIPDNDDLLAYWDTVADRLFKIRNCMNIEGVVRELPLYEPPIDPMLLVQAVAAGVDISSALSDLLAPRPGYRFQVMCQRAIEVCGDVRSLGNALLAALTNEDAEGLALLRASHETQLTDSLRTIKERQVEEAAEALDSAQESRVVVDTRQQYYERLLAERLSPHEQLQLDHLEDANRIGKNAEREQIAASALYLIPQLTGPYPIKFEFGGQQLGSAGQAVARWHGTTATQKVYEANRASIQGGHTRREDDWQFQSDSAGRELEQIDAQVAAAELRLAIAEQDLTNHDAQAERTRAVQDVMTTKYTNGELYGWMVSQLSALHSQSYDLAYDLAKRAQRAYEHETGVVDAGFIQFGYWDSLKKGLLAGDKLHNDLRRMEAAYLDDAREYEITKHISLAMIDPVALIKLRREGTCHIQLPEAQFDLDHPGTYMRRLKTVSLTIPSVAGPYTGVNCKLTLETSSIRVSSATTSTTTSAGYARSAPLDADERFRDEIGVSESVVTSVGDNDYGVFDVNPDAPRYLPFERRGVISTWQLELTDALPAFDYESISDVVIGLRYTAREGGELLKQACLKAIMDALRTMTSGSGNAGLMQAFSIRDELADAWYSFLNPAAAATSQTLELPIDESYFPYRFQGYGIQISTASLYLLPNPDATSPLMSVSAELALSNGGNADVELTPAPEPPDSNAYRPYLYAEDVALAGHPDTISLTPTEALSEETIDNLILVLNYDISTNS